MTVYTISVQKSFSASHQLDLQDGSKEPAHTHEWVLTVVAGADNPDKTGFVMDFRDLKTIIDDVIAEFANDKLEQLDYFKRKNSSAENLAKYLYDKISLLLPGRVNLLSVCVTEAPGCSAKYAE